MVELGKGNSEKMCLHPAPEGSECLWRSDAGWQAVPDARSSDEEGPVTPAGAICCQFSEDAGTIQRARKHYWLIVIDMIVKNITLNGILMTSKIGLLDRNPGNRYGMVY